MVNLDTNTFVNVVTEKGSCYTHITLNIENDKDGCRLLFTPICVHTYVDNPQVIGWGATKHYPLSAEKVKQSELSPLIKEHKEGIQGFLDKAFKTYRLVSAEIMLEKVKFFVRIDTVDSSNVNESKAVTVQGVVKQVSNTSDNVEQQDIIVTNSLGALSITSKPESNTATRLKDMSIKGIDAIFANLGLTIE